MGITIASMLLSGIVSWFFIKPVYQGKVVVAFAAISQLTRSGNTYILKDDIDNGSQKMSDNVDQLVQLAQVDAGKYRQLVTSVIVLQRTIEQLGLKDKLDGLKGKIKIEDAKEKNGVILISVDAETPELASNIANTLVNQTILYLDEINNRKMEGLRGTLEAQLTSARKDLDSSFARLKEYQLQSVPAGSTGEPRSSVIKTEIEKNRFDSEVKRNEGMVNSLSSKMLELEMYKSLNSAENQVVVLSPAVVPEKPVSPNKKLNVAIAGVLGLMIATFGVFVAEYMRKEEEM
jgi:uncharacterized protein involved in exopolysaccharide biosynthesis